MNWKHKKRKRTDTIDVGSPRLLTFFAPSHTLPSSVPLLHPLSELFLSESGRRFKGPFRRRSNTQCRNRANSAGDGEKNWIISLIFVMIFYSISEWTENRRKNCSFTHRRDSCGPPEHTTVIRNNTIKNYKHSVMRWDTQQREPNKKKMRTESDARLFYRAGDTRTHVIVWKCCRRDRAYALQPLLVFNSLHITFSTNFVPNMNFIASYCVGTARSADVNAGALTHRPLSSSIPSSRLPPRRYFRLSALSCTSSELVGSFACVSITIWFWLWFACNSPATIKQI